MTTKLGSSAEHVMNNEALKTHAELLNNAINVFRGESADVAFLSTYRPLLDAIDDAMHERIDGARDLGLSRWESDTPQG